MSFAVKLFLDSNTNKKVENFWLEMKESGVSNYMAESGYKPHVTLMGMPELDKTKCEEALKTLAKNTGKLSFSATNIGVFPYETYTVYLGVTHTEALRALHFALSEERETWAKDFAYFYEPDILVPHITLGCRLSKSEASSAASSAYALELPISGEYSSLALVDIETKETLFAFSLT